MAIFEKSLQNSSILDDTEKLSCIVESAQNINKHTEYVLRVQRGSSKENKWCVSRRYRDFAALHASLHPANIHLPLPPKKLIGNMQPSFIAERQIALQGYINEVLIHPILALSLHVRSFLDPNNYSIKISEQALQSVSIALRGDGRYELKGPLPDIGWRICKSYFLVTDMESKRKCILSWLKYGADKHLSNKDLQLAFKSMQNVSHPYIDPILSIHNLETGAFIVRHLHENGSIRDMLYGTDYAKNYLEKYGNPKIRKPFTLGQIAHYGYQILQALKFLHDKGIPHGHLHPGNIAIENQRVLLMDIENVLMGVACMYRPFLLELRRSSGAEAVDVYCFGHTLYEMAYASPLNNYYCDTFPEGTSDELESILRMCVSRVACKHGSITLYNLMSLPFFTRSLLNGLTPRDETHAHLKFPLSLKQELTASVLAIENRLKTEQNMLRKSKREVRIQEILNSEEEMRKQRRRSKKRDSVYKSTSSLAETVRSQSVSTASSPTPPQTTAVEQNGSSSVTDSVSPPASTDAHAALLGAICAFDKTRLTRVNSR